MQQRPNGDRRSLLHVGKDNRDSVMLDYMQQARRPQSAAVATTDAEVTAPAPQTDALALELLRRELQT